ncbi:MAG: biotin--[acetyl-CoA-carboxylase] ligase [Ruminococcus sp.]|nr:biotin--[acetyl-CoA-carboxylase] ligase [Ruminococcus sp.]
MKAEILKLLRESEDYISGQKLCDKLGVSRTAVWKVIQKLQEEGYQVEAVRNRGYHIAKSPDVVSREELESLLLKKTKWAGQKICYFAETDSTNIQAKRLGEEGAPHGTLVVADKQNAGRGRRGKGWESPSGHSVYMTLLLRPEIPPVKAPMLTLVMAYSVAEGLRFAAGVDARIKWPNDIVLHGKKLVGILTEMSTEIDFINHVVIGVGINVNMDSFPEEIADTATSLKIETGQVQKRGPLIVEILRRFEKNYETYLKTEDLSGLREAYNHLLVNCEREVQILGARDSYRAVALGINDGGELLVKKEDGSVEAVYAGEVSVRGIYGYV